ncbi:MAG: HD domain-containing protein [Actinomycetota bacterium]|nr:HD domain-containing protein [Actinomycetota bacterium]
MSLAHLARRFVTSLSRRPPTVDDNAWVRSWLTDREADLWYSMPVPDRRHSIDVARRFRERRPGATNVEMAGALLHDVGKSASGLGTFGRVFATIVGPRTIRLRRYHDHEAIGAEMAARAGSDPAAAALIRGEGPGADDLQAADDSI